MANTYPEPYRSKKKDAITDPSTCYNRECVSYTAWKIAECTGKWPKRTGDMNARNWIYRLPENGYGTQVPTPNGNKCVGVSTAGKYGHVVWSEGTLHISEYNYDSKGNYSERNVQANAYRWFVIKPAPSAGFFPSKGYWAKGDRDSRVGNMAAWLRATFPAYTPAAALGNYYGPNLERAVREFQRRCGLTTDGKTGPLTYNKMKAYGFKG